MRYFKWIFDFSWKLDGRLKPLSTISKRVYKLSGTIVTMFKGPWLTYMRYILWRTLGMYILNKYMFVIVFRPIVMIGIWIVVIFGMTTTFIFYLMTLLHLL